ncbi:uncharacterized protein J5F26_004443 isoform 1-T1 [Ciconia maguari]
MNLCNSVEKGPMGLQEGLLREAVSQGWKQDGGKGKQAEDGEADENQRNKSSYLCAKHGDGGEDITGFIMARLRACQDLEVSSATTADTCKNLIEDLEHLCFLVSSLPSLETESSSWTRRLSCAGTLLFTSQQQKTASLNNKVIAILF